MEFQKGFAQGRAKDKIMKTFIWKRVYTEDKTTGEKRFVNHSIIQLFPIDGAFQFWGSAWDKEGGYNVVAFDKQRHLQTVQETITDIEEAKLAIEKFLFDNEIIMEGDEVLYE